MKIIFAFITLLLWSAVASGQDTMYVNRNFNLNNVNLNNIKNTNSASTTSNATVATNPRIQAPVNTDPGPCTTSVMTITRTGGTASKNRENGHVGRINRLDYLLANCTSNITYPKPKAKVTDDKTPTKATVAQKATSSKISSQSPDNRGDMFLVVNKSEKESLPDKLAENLATAKERGEGLQGMWPGKTVEITYKNEIGLDGKETGAVTITVSVK